MGIYNNIKNKITSLSKLEIEEVTERYLRWVKADYQELKFPMKQRN